MSVIRANTQLTFSVGLTSIKVVSDNPSRSYMLLVNDSDTAIYISLGERTAVVNQGIRLNASGGSYEINTTNLWKGAISAVSSGASKTLTLVEW